MLEDYEVDWPSVIAHHDYRLSLSDEIRRLLLLQVDGFVDMCLGISNAQGNYSASEHNLGPRILSNNPNAKARVLKLALSLRDDPQPANMYSLIKAANIGWLKISVGSEIAMMLHPNICWVANTRTIWAHLLVKHEWNESTANEELKLYRDGDETSEMAYKKWTAIHREMRSAMTKLAEAGSQIATEGGLQPGTHKFLWADAIANWLYENC